MNKRDNRIIGPRLILASSSPRRAELLRSLGIKFQIAPPSVDESPLPDETPDVLVERLAGTKAQTAAWRSAGHDVGPLYVLGADTVVVLDGKILGKPANPAEAILFLKELSGKTHVVITGFCLVEAPDKIMVAGSARSKVTFRLLSRSEIEAYVNGGEPMDKAGGYSAHGEGRMLIDEITGSVSNVIGLPTEELVPWFRKLRLFDFRG